MRSAHFGRPFSSRCCHVAVAHLLALTNESSGSCEALLWLLWFLTLTNVKATCLSVRATKWWKLWRYMARCTRHQTHCPPYHHAQCMLCVCVCLCACACVLVSLCACVLVCLCACVLVCLCACVLVCLCACVLVVYACLIPRTCMCVSVCICGSGRHRCRRTDGWRCDGGAHHF